MKLKRVVAMLLCAMMVVSLAACGEKGKLDDSGNGDRIGGRPGSSAVVSDEGDKSKVEGEDEKKPSEKPAEKDDLTAESLLKTGFGVDKLKSVTFDMDFMVKEGANSVTVHCVYQQDEDYVYFTADEQYDERGNSIPMNFKFYYVPAEQMAYQYKDGEWVSGELPRYENGISKLTSTPFKGIVQNAELDTDDEEYYLVSGMTAAAFVNEMVEFVYDDAPTITDDVEVAFFYDKDTCLLEGMSWYALVGTEELSVTAIVEDINKTTVDFDLSEPDGDDEPGSTEQTTPSDAYTSCADGEEYLSYVLFDKGYVEVDELKAEYGDKYSEVDDSAWNDFQWYINMYSKEGFVRSFGREEYVSDSQKVAAVMMCDLLGVDYSEMYKADFMSETAAKAVYSKFN